MNKRELKKLYSDFTYKRQITRELKLLVKEETQYKMLLKDTQQHINYLKQLKCPT